MLTGPILTDLALVLLAFPIALYPWLNETRFDGAPETLGLLFTAVASGGALAALFAKGLANARFLGRNQLMASALSAACCAGLALVDGAAFTLALLFLAGVGDAIAVIARGAVLQLACDDDHRGRVSAFEQVAGTGGIEMGKFHQGALASLTGPPAAMILGGTLRLAALAAIAGRFPGLWDFERA